MDKILGWIPARCHSKGLPGKNKRLLGGKPLITHAIESAKKAACLDRIVVSTDDPDIADLAILAGAEVPWMRPAELATDDSPVIESVLYDLERLGRERNYAPGAVMLLQPTSPFRAASTIRMARAIFEQADGESVISVSPARAHPFWCQRLEEDGTLQPFLPNAPPQQRRQALTPAYQLAGVVYLARTETLFRQRSFYSARTKALVISSEREALDIDTPHDWLLAEALWNAPLKGETA